MKKAIAIIFLVGLIGILVVMILPKDYKGDSDYQKIYAIYDVKADQMNVDKIWKGADEVLNKTLWEKTLLILPEDYDVFIKKYIVFSDGREGINASTGTDANDNSEYEFYIDPKDAFDENDEFEPKRFILNIVHEYGHVIAQNNTQIDVKSKEPGTFIVTDGRLNEDSYLYAFYKRFWVDHYDAAKIRREISDPTEKRQVQLDFYEKHKDEFITDYATVSINEDFAESFCYFVLMKEIPEDQQLLFDKIRFFYEYDELVELRDEMRRNVDQFLD